MTTVRAENHDNDTEKVYGPFDWVQLTWEMLRVPDDAYPDLATIATNMGEFAAPDGDRLDVTLSLLFGPL